MPRASHLTFAWVLVAVAMTTGACRYPATEVLVELATDAPRDRPLDIHVTVVRGSDITAPGTHVAWARDAEHAVVSLPASFAIVPATDSPRDDLVTLIVEARLPALLPTESDVSFRRLARFRFVPRVGARLPIFLATSCGAPAQGCASTPCTVAALCEQSGQTCGDDGSCISPTVTLILPDAGAARDANDARADAATTDTIDAIALDVIAIDAITSDTRDVAMVDRVDVADVGIDVRPDVAVDSGIDIVDVRATRAAIGEPCELSADCASNFCVIDSTGRGVCTMSCSAPATCPSTWTCTSSRCVPPSVCSSGFVWGNPYGDNTLRLQSTWRIGMNGGTYSYAFACARDMSGIDLCGDSILTLAGGHASVIAGLGVRPIGGAHALTINQGMVAPIFVNLDAASFSTTITINALGSDVYIRSLGPAGVTLGGARCRNLVVQSGGTITNAGTISLTGTFSPGGAIPAAPACP